MPPKRKRLVVWAFLWLFLLSWLLDLGLEAAGIPQLWRSVLIGAALAAVFIPFLLAAATETRQLRAEGIDPLSHSPVTRRTFIFVSVSPWFSGSAWPDSSSPQEDGCSR